MFWQVGQEKICQIDQPPNSAGHRLRDAGGIYEEYRRFGSTDAVAANQSKSKIQTTLDKFFENNLDSAF